MQVKDLKIDDEYIIVNSTMTITQVSKEMAKAGISDAVVLDESSVVIGALDSYDIISKVLAVDLDPTSTRAEEIMYTFPNVTLATDIMRVQEILDELQIGMIPVVDEAQKLLGVATVQDVLIGMANDKKKNTSMIRKLSSLMR